MLHYIDITLIWSLSRITFCHCYSSKGSQSGLSVAARKRFTISHILNTQQTLTALWKYIWNQRWIVFKVEDKLSTINKLSTFTSMLHLIVNCISFLKLSGSEKFYFKMKNKFTVLKQTSKGCWLLPALHDHEEMMWYGTKKLFKNYLTLYGHCAKWILINHCLTIY